MRVARELDVDVTIPLPQTPSGGRFAPSPTRRDSDRARRGCSGPCGAALTIFTALPLVQMTSLERLHAGAAIDVGDDVVILRPRAASRKAASFSGGHDSLERATGVQIRQEDALRRIHDLRRLRHEMDAAEGDHLRIRLPPPGSSGPANRRRNRPAPGSPSPGNCARG